MAYFLLPSSTPFPLSNLLSSGNRAHITSSPHLCPASLTPHPLSHFTYSMIFQTRTKACLNCQTPTTPTPPPPSSFILHSHRSLTHLPSLYIFINEIDVQQKNALSFHPIALSVLWNLHGRSQMLTSHNTPTFVWLFFTCHGKRIVVYHLHPWVYCAKITRSNNR